MILSDGTTIIAESLDEDELLVQCGIQTSFNSLVEVRLSRSPLSRWRVTLNWSSVGSQNLEYSEAFGRCYQMALSIARLLDTPNAVERSAARTLCMSLYGKRT